MKNMLSERECSQVMSKRRNNERGQPANRFIFIDLDNAFIPKTVAKCTIRRGNLTGATSLDMLENEINPLITKIMENDENYSEHDLHFQQDGAPPHFAAPVLK
ncbi:hypothetical protein NQ317_010689 [Molorchus minor]|uniref:Transposase n=1 Tax=Molorchus minor TaxID=1323400 RepID=A0ABQ9K7B6_9CUCU|nr:hypothetical protein NQ317_010689 [Molorchus minor]